MNVRSGEHEEFDYDDVERRMKGAVKALHHELAGLRTGRAHISILDPVTVEAYGSVMPLNQVATVSVPEARMLSVQVWDKSMAGAVDKAIRNSDLGLNPISEGQLIRIPIPELNEERRRELTKVAHKYGEQARVAVRNVRRDGLDQLKHLEKDAHMSEDEHKAWADEVQELTNKIITEIDEMLATKDKEIMQV
ncbi:MAG: ribosome recycling factor [Hyphomicrobiales bacterium]|nr:MAG: ribosome recycling factor [Hyphomicrobiales bacterium]